MQGIQRADRGARTAHTLASDSAEDAVYRSLRDAIVGGRLPANVRVRESVIAERHGVSRTPVRAALGRLRREGYVIAEDETAARLQLVVAPLRAADIEELWQIIGALEGLAAATVSRRDPALLAHVADDMSAVNRRLEQEARTPDKEPELLVRYQSEFHWTLVGSLGTRRVRRLYGQIRPQAERYEFIYSSVAQMDYAESVAEHEVVVDLVRAGDGMGAKAAIEAHWARASERTGQTFARLWPDRAPDTPR